MDTYLYPTDSELPLENGHAEIEGEGEGGTEHWHIYIASYIYISYV